MVVPSFAAESDREVVLAECTPEYASSISMFGIPSPAKITVGESYIVVWNGVEYYATAYDLDMLGDAPHLINDGADLSTGEGAVFVIALGEDEDEGFYGLAAPMDGTTELTLAIYKSSSGDSSDTVVTDPFITSFSFSFADIGDSATNYDGFLVGLVSGQMYEVIYNGTSYICEAKTGDYLGYPYVYVGNPKKAFNGVLPADGDLPFGYVEIDTGTKMTFVGGSGATSGVVYDFSFYHYIKPADEVLRDDITSVVSSSTGWVGSFVEAITESPLLLLFVLTSFVSLGISIISLVKRK